MLSKLNFLLLFGKTEGSTWGRQHGLTRLHEQVFYAIFSNGRMKCRPKCKLKYLEIQSKSMNNIQHTLLA